VQIRPRVTPLHAVDHLITEVVEIFGENRRRVIREEHRLLEKFWRNEKQSILV
jgi:hypothetical protein